MTIEKMRAQLTEVYSGPTWRLRVSGMSDDQVIAIYKNMKAEGRLYKHPSRKKKEPDIKKAVQLSMFDKDYNAAT